MRQNIVKFYRRKKRPTRGCMAPGCPGAHHRRKQAAWSFRVYNRGENSNREGERECLHLMKNSANFYCREREQGSWQPFAGMDERMLCLSGSLLMKIQSYSQRANTRSKWTICGTRRRFVRSEEHTSELQSRENLVCRL